MTVDPLQQVLDRIAIEELKARYFRLLDTKQWEAWRELFVDDLQFQGAAQQYSGADVFVRAVSHAMAETRTVHHGHLGEVVFIGRDSARAVWAMSDLVVWRPGTEHVLSGGITGQYGFRGWGHYEEEYRRLGGEWKISRSTLTRLRVEALVGEPPPVQEFDVESRANDDWLRGTE
jgi:SnoaL-like domain